MANASDLAIAALTVCSRHNATRVPRLADCASLAPSGTGSDTVASFLRAARSPWVHHDHGMTLHGYRSEWAGAAGADSLGLQRYKRSANSAPPSCFLISLREPVARLESLKRLHDQKVHPAHWNRTVGLDQILRHSLPRARWYVETSQVDYLGPMNQLEWECRSGVIEIHVLCTDELDAGFARLRDFFGEPPVASHSAMERRSDVQWLMRRGNATYEDASAFLEKSVLHDPQLRDSVSHSLFAADHAVHEHFCPSRGEPRRLSSRLSRR